ncbi:MAG: D-xylonolactonase [Acidimicrobiales bacterium]|jgi:xylono-1,5-lactonase
MCRLDSGPTNGENMANQGELTAIAWGYGLVEGPRTDSEDNLYFSDVIGGGVFRRSPDGVIETLVPERKMVGGLALHTTGGFVMTGSTVAHWLDGDMRVLLERDGVTSFNDCQTDQAGRLYVGAIRSNLDDLRADKIPGECYRINLDGSVDELYGGIEVSNGIGLSPDGTTLFHVDSTAKGVITHDLAADGSVSNRRLIGQASFERGIPDGMCIDVDGNLWIAHVGGRRVVKIAPTGEELDAIPVPAKAVTSVAFGGPEMADMYIVTADNLEDEAKGGTIFRTRPGVRGLPTHLATI